MDYKIEGNHVEIYFDDIPSEEIRESLKICGWHWIKKKRCWSNFLTKENIEFAKMLCENSQLRSKSKLLTLEKYSVGMTDLLVRSNSFYCNKHHELEDMAGEIKVRDKVGNILTYLVPIAHCKRCNIYYILEDTYLTLKKRELQILCPILSYKEYCNGQTTENSREWNETSLLRMWGYTVSQVEGYSEAQRQGILEDLVDLGIMSKDRILSYLDFFIRINENKGNVALNKWNLDRAYIANYRLGSAKRVEIGSITIIDYVSR